MALHRSVVLGLQYVIVVFPDHTHLLFVFIYLKKYVSHTIPFSWNSNYNPQYTSRSNAIIYSNVVLTIHNSNKLLMVVVQAIGVCLYVMPVIYRVYCVKM